MKVYISSHHPDPANALAASLVAAGHSVVSTWHTLTGARLAMGDEAACRAAVDRNCEEIESADALVLVASPDHLSGVKRVQGGKFFEAGYAHGLRTEDGGYQVRVFTVGGVENGMLYTTGVRHAADVAQLIDMLS